MTARTDQISPASVSPGAVPRSLWMGWLGGAALGLATAGFAGALIMRSGQTASPSPAETPAVASIVAQPAPLAAPVAAPAAARPRHTKPVTVAAPDVAVAQAASQPPAATEPAAAEVPAAVCASCGVVESVTAVQQKGQATGLGAVAGGVLGGVVGHQVGGGKGKTAMTVLGAIGGGLAGNEVEKRARSETLYSVQVRMEDGSTRVLQQAQSFAVGTRVIVEGTTLRVARDAGRSEPSAVVRSAALPSAGA